jgi:3-hydroxy-9,10-secoandrosta-1,3,5(10)-triene-9,17-dione monooxygenase
LLPGIRERAADAEAQRSLPEATIKEIREAGLFGVIKPVRWGGHELDPRVFLEIASLLGSACGSTGWVYSVLCVHNWQLALFPLETQEEVWGADDSVLLCSSYTPRGVVEVVDGGYRLSGRWQFSSGSAFAEWAFVGGFRPTPDGGKEMVSFLVPRTDYRIEDTWHVMGLRGTGSNDLVVDDKFVPEHRVHPFTSGSTTSDSPIYSVPFTALFGYSLTAPILGMAIGAYDEHVRYTRDRERLTAGKKVATESTTQIRVAEAAVLLDAVKLQIDDVFEQMLAAAETGEVPLELRARARRDQVWGTRAAIEALDLVFANSGASAIREESPIQRFWRDAHAGSVHNSNVPEPLLAAFGALSLGQLTDGSGL